MKRLLLLPVLLLSLALAGCGPGSKVGDLISAATTTIANPVGPKNIYQLKNLYAATLELSVQWREYCWSKPYAVLMADPVSKSVCQDRRGTVRTIQAYQPKAGAAVRRADRFVKNNPTLNAMTVISEGWDAVSDFRNAIPAK